MAIAPRLISLRLNYSGFWLWPSLIERLVRDERTLRGKCRFTLVETVRDHSRKGSQTRRKTREQIFKPYAGIRSQKSRYVRDS